MEFTQYRSAFEQLVNGTALPAPYDNPDYLAYTKMNWSRMNRWLKKGTIAEQLRETVARITKPQRWIVITEPWCGDAAHSVPFIEMAARTNPMIAVEYELRDAAPFRINGYLTNGGKSIPKLIVRDEGGRDLAVWGPRPVECQHLFDRLKADGADFETQKIALQHWYNADKGQSMQQELQALLAKSQ